MLFLSEKKNLILPLFIVKSSPKKNGIYIYVGPQADFKKESRRTGTAWIPEYSAAHFLIV